MSKVLKRVSLFALVIVAFSAVILGGTLAKYKTTLTGTGTGTAATWNITAGDDKQTSFTFTLTPTGDETLQPGSVGKFEIKINNDGQADAIITVGEIAVDGEDGPDFTFTVGDGTNTEYTVSAGTSQTITINWEWAFGDEVDDTKFAGTTINVTATLNAEQVNPNASAAA